MSPDKRPVFLENDPREIRLMIEALQSRSYTVRRPSPHHIKVGPCNFFPTTGKITIDPHTSHQERGFRAFLQFLEMKAEPVWEINLDTLPDIAPPLAAK